MSLPIILDDTQRNKESLLISLNYVYKLRQANCPTTAENYQVQCTDGSFEFIPYGQLNSVPSQCQLSGGILRCPPNINRMCSIEKRLICIDVGCEREAIDCPVAMTIESEHGQSFLVLGSDLNI